ncbi:hypothetical protein GH714_000668 [Hevea brasiliensis]|uniref:RING-type domain-containing protein n=1 Tax=Hevea brasiliensis TaxID=3981 RepID=A0A6A6L855_HEVBR|nr:hypothetical protein GH714_000668 [Hevea brasiliensis]
MDSATYHRYVVEVSEEKDYPISTAVQEKKSHSYDFNIILQFSHKIEIHDHPHIHVQTMATMEHNSYLPHSDLHLLRQNFQAAGLPASALEEEMMQIIFFELQFLTSHDFYLKCNILPVRVCVELVTVLPEQECSSRVARAVKVFGGALERGRFKEDWSLPGQCVICLEDLSVGKEVTALPCWHMIHQDCAFECLQRSCTLRQIRHQ